MLLFANLNNEEGEEGGVAANRYRMLRGLGVILAFLVR